MKKYTIHCTAEQTRKALELGAPIFTFSESFADSYRTSIYDKYCSIPAIKEEGYEDDVYADTPTTEQMIGWLEDQGLHISVIYNDCTYKPEVRDMHDGFINDDEYFNFRKEATIAAIDAALVYLTNNNG